MTEKKEEEVYVQSPWGPRRVIALSPDEIVYNHTPEGLESGFPYTAKDKAAGSTTHIEWRPASTEKPST